MNKVFVIAVREYLAAVRTKAFLVSLLLMPVLWGGSIVLQAVLRDKVDISDKRVAVVDYSGKMFDAIEQAAIERNSRSTAEDGILEPETKRQVKPKFVFERIAPTSDDATRVGLELSDRIRRNAAGDIMAFVIIDRDVVERIPDPVRPGVPSVNYYSNSPTYDDIQNWITTPINKKIRDLRLEAANLDRRVVENVIASARVSNLGLVSLDDAGNIKQAQETNELANIFMPLGLMMLMLMVIMLGSTPLMQSVLEEKQLRIAEVLLGSARPFQIMLGKLLGMVGVSLTVATVYLVGAYVAVRQAGFAEFFPAHVVWWFILYLALAVLMFGSIFIAVGASVSDMKESQNLITPVMLVAVAPMFVWINVVKEPNSAMSTALSFFPTATPMLMIVRQAVPPGIPAWQPIVGSALVLITTIAFVFAAGRIFRVGILMQGKGAKFSEMFRWVLRG